MPKPVIAEGQTATNPQTGQKIVYQKGRWMPYSGTAAAPVKTLTPQEEAQLGEARSSANMFADVSGQAEAFGKLNEQSGTGPIFKIPGAKTVVSMFNPKVAQMQALTARMAPQQRVPGSGTTSDRDLDLFLKAVPDIERMGSGNAGVIDDMKGMAEKRRQRAYFLDRYAQEKGTLRGAQEAFDTMWAQKQQGGQKTAQRPSLDQIFK